MMKKFSVVFVFAFLAISCEKVIDVPLNDADRLTVFEAVLNDRVESLSSAIENKEETSKTRTRQYFY